jgi:hypothetical protein
VYIAHGTTATDYVLAAAETRRRGVLRFGSNAVSRPISGRSAQMWEDEREAVAIGHGAEKGGAARIENRGWRIVKAL